MARNPIEEELERALLDMKGMMISYASRTTKRPEESEELFQEAAYRAYAYRHRIRDVGSVKPWVWKIFFNIILNYSSRSDRKCDYGEMSDYAGHANIFNDIASCYTRNGGSPEKEFFMNHIDESIWEVIDSLPDKYQLPFKLSCCEDYDYKDISRMYGIPLGTVKSRINRARKMLREQLPREITA